MVRKKTWTEKLADSKDLPRVERISEKMSKGWGSGAVVIPAPNGSRRGDEESVMGKTCYNQRDT